MLVTWARGDEGEASEFVEAVLHAADDSSSKCCLEVDSTGAAETQLVLSRPEVGRGTLFVIRDAFDVVGFCEQLLWKRLFPWIDDDGKIEIAAWVAVWLLGGGIGCKYFVLLMKKLRGLYRFVIFHHSRM